MERDWIMDELNLVALKLLGCSLHLYQSSVNQRYRHTIRYTAGVVYV